MRWCPSAERAARLLCRLLLEEGADPNSAAREALRELERADATCIEDVGRSMMRHPGAGRCAEILESASLEGETDDRVLGLLFMVPYTYYRRIRDVEAMKRVVRKYRHLERRSPLLGALILHARAMLVEKSEEFTLEDRILDALVLEEQALKQDPGYVGAAHKHADLVAQLLESGYEPGDCEEPMDGCIPRSYVARAIRTLRSLARELHYPRAYFTLGRIMANLGEFRRAESLISEAIRLEDPKVRDYTFRLAEYYNYLFLTRNMARMQARLEKFDRLLQERIRETREMVEREVRSYEERILAWTSIYVAMMAIIMTYLYTTTSPNLTFTHALILLAAIYASIIGTILAVSRILQARPAREPQSHGSHAGEKEPVQRDQISRGG